MNTQFLHELIFYVMYLCLAGSVIVIIERAIYFFYTQRQAVNLEQQFKSDIQAINFSSDASKKSLPLKVIAPILANKQNISDETSLNDAIETQFLLSKAPLSRGIWFLETITTAAPLLGLLGTIMGIVDTFKALSEAGISDPSKVSAGMGVALYATALGIAIALLCLVANNFLQNRMDRIGELLKVLLIRSANSATHKA